MPAKVAAQTTQRCITTKSKGYQTLFGVRIWFPSENGGYIVEMADISIFCATLCGCALLHCIPFSISLSDGITSTVARHQCQEQLLMDDDEPRHEAPPRSILWLNSHTWNKIIGKKCKTAKNTLLQAQHVDVEFLCPFCNGLPKKAPLHLLPTLLTHPALVSFCWTTHPSCHSSMLPRYAHAPYSHRFCTSPKPNFLTPANVRQCKIKVSFQL